MFELLAVASYIELIMQNVLDRNGSALCGQKRSINSG